MGVWLFVLGAFVVICAGCLGNKWPCCTGCICCELSRVHRVRFVLGASFLTHFLSGAFVVFSARCSGCEEATFVVDALVEKDVCDGGRDRWLGLTSPMRAAAERMQQGYLQRDWSPRGWGPRQGHPRGADGVLEILAAKERRPRCIGDVAK